MKRVIKASNSDVMNNMIEDAKAIVTECLGELGITVGNISEFWGGGHRLIVDDVSYNGHTYDSTSRSSDIHANISSTNAFDVTKIDSIEDYKKTSSYIDIVSTVFLYEIYGYKENVATLQDWATQALNNIVDDTDGIHIDGSFDGGSVYMTGSQYTGYSEDLPGYLTLFPRRPLNVYYQGEYNEYLSRLLPGRFQIKLTVEDAMDFLNGVFNYSQMEKLIQAEFNEWHSEMPRLLAELQEREDKDAQVERNFAKLADYLESRLSEFDFHCDNYALYTLYGTYSLSGNEYEISTEIDLSVSDTELEQQLTICYRRIRKSILRRKRNLAKKAQDSAML